ncbi:MAG: ABC transporter permease [Myxococcaceae bacterium]
MPQLFLIAVRNLAQHSKRSLLLGGAIAAVTALLVLVFGLTTGIRDTMLKSATTLMTGHVNVGGFFKATAGQSAPVVAQYQAVLDIVRREVPELQYVSSRGRGWAKVISETGSVQAGLSGLDIDTETGFAQVIQVASGSLEALRQPNTILIFEEQSKKLGVKVGDLLTLSAPTLRGSTNTLDVQVAVIARDAGLLSSFTVFVDNAGLRSLYQLKDDTTGALQLYLKDVRLVPEVKNRLREKFEKAGYAVLADDPRSFWMKFEVVNREPWTGQKLDITTWEDEISFMKWTLTALAWISAILIVVLLIVISVGIMNTLWISIRERTREVGTLRAIGMQRRRVLAMFLMEGFTLGLLGTFAGAAIGGLACVLVNAAKMKVPIAVQLFVMSDTLHFMVRPADVALSILIITGCTTVISLFPSFLAARMKPVTAMHHIG